MAIVCNCGGNLEIWDTESVREPSQYEKFGIAEEAVVDATNGDSETVLLCKDCGNIYQLSIDEEEGI